MAGYTDDEAQRASRIVELLLFQGEAPRDRLTEGFSIVDVESHAKEFRYDAELLEWADLDFLAVELEGGLPVPMSLAAILDIHWLPFLPGRSRRASDPFAAYFPEALNRAYTDFANAFPGELRRLRPDQARQNFFVRARDFLATRLAALRRFGGSEGGPAAWGKTLNLRQYAGGATTQVAGCQFLVSTNSPGLSVYWSGAYYISPNYLGAPTSPAVGVLQAGTYVFGINGGAYGNSVQWDTNAVCTLPGQPSVHLQY